MAVYTYTCLVGIKMEIVNRENTLRIKSVAFNLITFQEKVIIDENLTTVPNETDKLKFNVI